MKWCFSKWINDGLLSPVKVENKSEEFVLYMVHESGGKSQLLFVKLCVCVFMVRVSVWLRRKEPTEGWWVPAGVTCSLRAVWENRQDLHHGGRPGRGSHLWCESGPPASTFFLFLRGSQQRHIKRQWTNDSWDNFSSKQWVEMLWLRWVNGNDTVSTSFWSWSYISSIVSSTPICPHEYA